MAEEKSDEPKEEGNDSEEVEEKEDDQDVKDEQEFEKEKSPLEKRKIGSLTIDLNKDKSNDNVIVYTVNANVGEKSVSFELPRYDTYLGWIEAFGIPPFNEWVLLDQFEYIDKNFSGSLNDKKYSESVEVEKKGVTGHRINLQRTMEDGEEYFNTRKFEAPGNNEIVSISECISSKGVYTAKISQKSWEDCPPEKIGMLLEFEEEYANKIIEEEGKPDIIILKQSVVDGPTPAVYRNLFPFWETDEFSEMPVRSIELGYLGRGDNETELDQAHGDWFKLFSFQDFDHNHLEIREGNWKSTTDWFKSSKKNTKKHYEKKLYKYNRKQFNEVKDDEEEEN